MVKKLFLPMTLLSVVGLGAFTPGARAQDGVAHPAAVGQYNNSGYYIAMPRHDGMVRPPNPTYWTKLPCPLSHQDPCDPCYQDRGLWTTPAVRWVLDPNYYAVAPDYGWSVPGKWPIVRHSPVYNKYTPDVWYGTGRGGQQAQQSYPIVGQPTDTSQMGYYYQTVPTWQPNPGMLPAPPNPRTWHYRPYELGADGSYRKWVPLRTAWVPLNQIPNYQGGGQIQAMPQPANPAAPAVQPEAIPAPAAPVPPPPPPAVPAPEASNEPELGGGTIRKASFLQRVFQR